MKVVFDTDILVSAIVFPGGRGEVALRRIIEERDQLVLSKPILDELLGNSLANSRAMPNSSRHVAVFLSDLAHYVKPRRRLQVVNDEPDNRVLECSLTGRADAIVMGDHALLALCNYRDVHIISIREYLDM